MTGTASSTADLIVVGGGVVGSAVAIEASRRGASVTLVEKNTPGTGATGASAGMLAPQYEAPGPGPTFRFGVRSRAMYGEFSEGIESLARWPVGYCRDGMLVASWTPGDERAAGESVEWQRKEGCRAEVVAPSEARRIHPGVSEAALSYLWLPDEAQVDAQRLAVALGGALRAAGVRMVLGEVVRRLRAPGAVVEGVELDGGKRLDSRRVVLATGAWAGRMEGLPRRIPVRPVRGQMLRLRPEQPAARPLVADHQGHYLVPREHGTVLAGSTMEEAGFDERTTEEGRLELAEGASRLVPALADAPVVEAWAGLRPMTDDHLPLLGPDPDTKGLFYAAGHGRNGILFAPLTARAVAGLALEGKTDVEWKPFRCDR